MVVKDLLTKTGLIAHLAQATGHEPKAVKATLVALEETMSASLGKKGPGSFTLPGMFKIMTVKVAARKAYTGIDRFTKQERKFAAKPASTKVKVRALKKLRDVAGA